MANYYSDRNISFDLLIKDKSKRIKFNPTTKGGSVYVTTEKEEIEAIESSFYFKKWFVRTDNPAPSNTSKIKDKTKPDDTEKPDKLTETVVDTVTSWQEAADYLVNECGSDPSALTTPEAILAAAKEKHVEFPNIG
ncbi:MAG: hypothetical protein LBM61_07430 [Prevotellaceae bacterium]|jgi:hypothetical protein|nr:hypothetical protein [Prevotellaceae bacterium]